MQKRRDFSTARSVGEAAKKIIFLALIVLAGYKLISVSFGFGRSLFYVDPAEAAPGTDVEITISDDDDIESLAEMLYYDGVITNTLSFRVQGTLYNIDPYPGDYEVNTSLTIKEIISEIADQAEALRESEAEAAQSAEMYAGDEISGGYEGDETESYDQADVTGGGSESD